MRKMKDSGIEWIGAIPEDWEIVQLNKIFTERKFKNAGNVVRNVLSLSYGNIVRRNVENNMGLLPESFETYNIVEPGNIVLRLTDLQNDHKSLRCGIVKERGIITSAYVTLEKIADIDTDYFYRLFHTFDIEKGFYGMGEGVRQSLKFNGELSKLFLILPKNYEQTAIKKFLDDKCSKIDNIIEKTRKQIELLKAYRQSIITEIITKGLDPAVPTKDSGVEWIGEISENWTLVKIKNTTTKIGSGKTPLGGAEIYSNEGIFFLRSQNIQNTGLSLTDVVYIDEKINEEMSASKVCENDILLNITGASIGRACIFPENLGSANVNQHVCILRVSPNIMNNEFLRCFIISSVGQTIINLFQSGANREGLNFEQIKNIKVCHPNLEEQKIIADYLNDKMSKIDFTISKKEHLIEKLYSYKKSLIYEAVTGKVEIE